MKIPVGAAAILLLAGTCAGCSAATRYKVLSTLFDGVPPPRVATPETGPQGPGAPAAAAQAAPRDHGPYAAHLCDACHVAAATNALIVPKDQLCARCHEIRLDRAFVHGPAASGGCLVCHDPHSSRNRLLLLSDSESVCFHCHDAQAVGRIEGHRDVAGRCTECHDAHASDRRFLLK